MIIYASDAQNSNQTNDHFGWPITFLHTIYNISRGWETRCPMGGDVSLVAGGFEIGLAVGN